MILQVHTIKPAKGARHKRKIVGRGNASGHGSYSGHGGKGQTARSGGTRGLRLKSFKFLLQSTPKLRGFKSPLAKPVEVYLSDLDKHFSAGTVIDLAALKEKKLVSVNAKSAKILSSGEITKALTVSGIACTKQATEKIKAAGGEVK